MSNNILTLEKIKKSFRQGNSEIKVLKDASISVGKQEIVALIGASGCGKSTLLQIAGLLDTADSGEITIEGEKYSGATDKKRTQVRRDKIGFVYQYHHLLAEFSALENVMIPQMIAGKEKPAAEKKAKKLLKALGLGKRISHRPAELSGGEQQRVAIARALANDPAMLLADEPTGNLDPHTAETVFKVLIEQVKKSGLSMLMVTHNAELAKKADRIFAFKDDKIVKA